MPSGLWVVATPLGNLGDMPPRALQALSSADAILCEDTRRTLNLLRAFEIQGRLERLDAHASAAQVNSVVERLKKGGSFALVSDAGTPGISDPGAKVVALAHDAGICVTPIPGPSAVATLLSVSGFEGNSFAFFGFFPRSKREKTEMMETLQTHRLITVAIWFESPKRILESLGFIAERLPDARLVVGKEMTKLHEKFFAGVATQVHTAIVQEIQENGEIGEWCFAVELPHVEPDAVSESLGWVKTLECLIGAGVSVSESVRTISQHFGAPQGARSPSRKEIYERALRLFAKISEKKIEKNDEGD